MFFNKQFYRGVAVIVAVAACSDGAPPVAAPVQPGQPPAIPAGRSPDSDERVTVIRTIDGQVSAAEGQPTPPREHRTRTITFGAGTISARPDSLGAMQGALMARSRAKPTSADDLPLVGLTVPARRTSFRNSVAPYRRTVTTDDAATVIDLYGTGDAPPSTMRVSRNGVTVMTVVQEWEPWQRQWNLVRRETTTPDNSLHEVIEVTRTGRTGTALQSLADWSRTVGTGGQSGPSYDLYDDGGDCVQCAKERADAEAALATAIVKDAAAVLACMFVPPPATVLACITAMAVAAEAAAEAVSLGYEQYRCEVAAPPCPPTNPPPGDCSTHPSTGHQFGPSFTCASSGGGGETSGNGSHTECTYYYEYDLYTGQITYSELLFCAQVSN